MKKLQKKLLECLKNSVPMKFQELLFYLEGQSEIEATENLNLINKNNNTNFIMTYSYGRAFNKVL